MNFNGPGKCPWCGKRVLNLKSHMDQKHPGWDRK